MMRMNGGDHAFGGLELAAILGAHADRPAGASRYPLDIDAGDDLAAVILDAAYQRLGQTPAASDGHTEPIRLQKSKEHVHAKRGAFLIGSRQTLRRHAGKQQPYPVVLEGPAQQLVGAHLSEAPELL